MKKTKLLSIVLVVSIMLMGAGYAYWQEALTINNTINTGELAVVWQDADTNDEGTANGETNAGDYMTVEAYGDPATEVNYSWDNSEVAGYTNLIFNIEDIFPGANGTFTFRINNVGTLAAKIKGIDLVDITDVDDIKDRFDYNFQYQQYNADDTAGTHNGTISANDFDDLISDLNDTLVGIVLEPGDYILFNDGTQSPGDDSLGLGYTVSMDADKIMLDGGGNIIDDNYYEGKSMSFELKIDFGQYNETTAP